MFLVVVLFIVLPPIALVACLIALEFVGQDRYEARLRWRQRAKVSSILSLGSAGLLIFLVYALSHLD